MKSSTPNRGAQAYFTVAVVDYSKLTHTAFHFRIVSDNLPRWIYMKSYTSLLSFRCFTDFKIEWSRELGSSPFVGMPVITDVNGDGSLDIVAVSFSGEVHVVQAHNGQQLLKANWPFKLAHTSVLASPLQV